VIVEVADAFKLADVDRYDAIVLSGSLPTMGQLAADSFARALKVGGRLFAVVGRGPAMQAVKITRTAQNDWQREELFETVIPPLVNAYQPSSFVF
jgi:protein-L-isoaspartate(D-aspartate) O-methyltransferase